MRRLVAQSLWQIEKCKNGRIPGQIINTYLQWPFSFRKYLFHPFSEFIHLQFEKLIVLLHYHLLQVSDICNIYIYVTFCVTNTRDFRALSTNNIVTANWKVGETFQNTKLVCLFYISVHYINIPIDLAWDKTVRKPLQLFYYNCQSNHVSLIDVLSPRNGNPGDKVMDRSCVSK